MSGQTGLPTAESAVKVTETDDKQDFDQIKEDADYIVDEKASTADPDIAGHPQGRTAFAG